MAHALQMTLETDKPAYAEGENITLIVKFKNVGKQPLSFCTYNLIFFPNFIELKGSGGKTYLLKDLTKYDLSGPLRKSFVPLKPGEEYRRAFSLRRVHKPHESFCFLEKGKSGRSESDVLWQIPAGTYEITASHHSEHHAYYDYEERSPVEVQDAWVGQISSNTITVKIE